MTQVIPHGKYMLDFDGDEMNIHLPKEILEKINKDSTSESKIDSVIGERYIIQYLDENHYLVKDIKASIKIDTIFNKPVCIKSPHAFAFDQELFKLGRQFLEENGYENSVEITDYNALQENWNIKVDGPTAHALGKHVDDFGGVDDIVNTILVYLNVSDTVTGGELVIYKDDDFEEVEKIVDPHSKDGKICVVIIRGDVPHSINEMDGEGIRQCFAIQIPCERLEEDA